MYGVKPTAAAAAAGGGPWSGAENATKSIVIENTSSKYLSRSQGGALSNPDRAIGMAWVRRIDLGDCTIHQTLSTSGGGGVTAISFQFKAAGTLELYLNNTYTKKTTALLRDVEWMPLLWSFDSSQAIAADRVQIYLGRELLALTGSNVPINTNIYGYSGAGATIRLGHYWTGSTTFYPLNASVAQHGFFESVSIQNGDYAISDFFGEESLGTNGTVTTALADADLAAIATACGGESHFLGAGIATGVDASDNGNDFTATGTPINSEDSPSDPTVVFSLLHKPGSSLTISEGGRRAELASGSSWVPGHILIPPSGKYYVELLANSISSSGMAFGVCNPDAEQDASPRSSGFLHWESDGDRYLDSAQTASEVTAWSNGDVVGLGINMDDSELNFYNNAGTLEATVGFGSNVDGSEGVLVFMGQLSGGGVQNGSLITDEEDITHGVPSSYTVLKQTLLTAPAGQGADYSNVMLYTGNGTAIGSGGNAITGVGFQPDWATFHKRTSISDWHTTETVTGVTKDVEWDTTSSVNTFTEALSSFDSDGFTVGSNSEFNTNSATMLSVVMKAAASAAANTDGDIASTVAVNDVGSFSVVGWTGNATADQSVGHGLGKQCLLVMVKNKSRNTSWAVADNRMTNQYLRINTSASVASSSNVLTGVMNDSVFTVGTDNSVNQSGDPLIAYCFGHVPGVCEMRRYIGNGSADGPLVLFSFTPRWVIFKAVTAGQNWYIVDTARSPRNTGTTIKGLFPDLTSAEQNMSAMDILGHGLKIRSSSGSFNGSGTSHFILGIADIAGGAGLPPLPGR